MWWGMGLMPTVSPASKPRRSSSTSAFVCATGAGANSADAQGSATCQADTTSHHGHKCGHCECLAGPLCWGGRGSRMWLCRQDKLANWLVNDGPATTTFPSTAILTPPSARDKIDHPPRPDPPRLADEDRRENIVRIHVKPCMFVRLPPKSAQGAASSSWKCRFWCGFEHKFVNITQIADSQT